MFRVDEDKRPLLEAWLRLAGLAESAVTDGPIGDKGINLRMWPAEISTLVILGEQYGISAAHAAKVVRVIVRSHLAYHYHWPDGGEVDTAVLEGGEWWAGRTGPAAALTAQLERLDAETLEEVVGAGLAMLEPAARRRLLGG